MNEIEQIQFNEAKTDWFISILSTVIDLIMGSANGGKFKNKPYISIRLKNRDLKLELMDSDISEAKIIFQEIKSVSL